MEGILPDILFYRIDYEHHNNVSHIPMKKITKISQDVTRAQNGLKTVTKLTVFQMSNITPMNKVGKKRT